MRTGNRHDPPHVDQIISDRDLDAFPPPRAEMTRTELMAFHHRAIALARIYREFFGDVKRPSGCQFDAKPPGTLAGFKQRNRG